MKPVDPRLLRASRAARRGLAAAVATGVAQAVLLLGQAGLLAGIVARVFLGGASFGDETAAFGALVAVVGARALLAAAGELAAERAAAGAKSELRRRVLTHALALGPVHLGGTRAGELAALATRGLDGLDGWFSRYLPQLVLAAVVPVAVIARVLAADWPAALVLAVTVPLIPVFMILVGQATRRRTTSQWQALSRLGGHFLDVVEGLATLRVFGRARYQAEVLRRMADEHRRATLASLRVAFLSSLVLELLATLGTAIVAVTVGLRLLAGDLDFATALFVLVLAPEAYQPLRQVGASFHASSEGVEASEAAFAILETPAPASRPSRLAPVPDLRRDPLRLEAVTFTWPGRSQPALDSVSLRIDPGERVALVGPSGAGKSTLVALLLRFVDPDAGRILVGGQDLVAVDPDVWRALVAWVPQRPHIFAGSIADNIRLGRPDATDAEVCRAAAAANAAEFIAALPSGLDTEVGERGVGLSAGQRQRIALARAFLRNAALLLLDEPTAHLDAESQAAVVGAMDRLLVGRTGLVVAHRLPTARAADRVVVMDRGRIVEDGDPAALLRTGGPWARLVAGSRPADESAAWG